MNDGGPERLTRTRSLVSALGNLLTKIVIYPLAFVASVVVDRWLGPHERGLFSFLLLVGSFVLPLLTFGFGGAVIYLISAGKRQPADVTFTALVVGLLQGVLSAAVTYGLWRSGLLGVTGRATGGAELGIMLALVPLQGLQLMGSRVLFGESRFATSNWLNIGRAALNPLLLLLFVVGLDMGLAGAVIATAILNVVLTVATIWCLRPGSMRWAVDRAFFTEAGRYGLKMWVGDLATRANLRLDQMLLAIFATPAALGNYSVAVRLSEFLWVGADSVTPVLFNRLAQASDDKQRIELAGRVHRVGFVAMVLTACFAGLVGWWAIPWAFGAEFSESAFLFQLLLPGTVVLYTAKVITKYFGAVARPELAGRLGLMSGVIGALAYFSLIPLGATTGAALASSLSYIVMSAAAVTMYQRLIAPERGKLFRWQGDDWAWLKSQVRLPMRARG